tara:strand:- start:28940 stop:30031 length:1092 start_codon:yes stop_codon:yes gene_type:complete
VNITFRTDASYDIGSGHVMRCLALADVLRLAGATCRFVCRDHPGNLIDFIQKKGFSVARLAASICDVTANNARYSAWLGADWLTDAEQTIAALGSDKVDWMIVDHYALDVAWENKIRVLCHRLAVIDDLADRHHVCDVLIDQNLGRVQGDYHGLVHATCEVLVGPRYALLRPEFECYRECSLARRALPEFKRLLITMGGVDKNNITSNVLQALKKCSLHCEFHISVVMGLHAPWIDHVRTEAGEFECSIEVLVNIQNMAQLMAESDFVIGAAGSASWERCVLGLPSLLVVLADNQQVIANALVRAGAAQVTREQQLADDIKLLITQLSDNPSLLAPMSTKASQISDGLGANIVAKALSKYFSA